MSIFEIILISLGLSMDAFAVSICKGLSMKKRNLKNNFIIAFYFGLFQTVMPFLGYYLGSSFKDIVISIDHFISFFLLLLIGGNMIKESFSKNNDLNDDDFKIDFKTMIILAIATSIDAFAVGITFAFLNVNLVLAISLIGIVTFCISFIGVFLGNKFGYMYKNKAEFFGGVILIFLGFKILFEHLGFFLFMI